MKYKQNKTINLVLTLVLILTLSIIPINASYAGETSERNVTTGLTEEEQIANASSAFDPERLANLDISRELYIKLIDSFSQEPVPEAADYPDWYGGCFMDDKGKLVIYVTPDYSEGVQQSKVKEEVISIVGSSDFLFAPCQYSYRQLTETMDYLNNTILGAKESTVADNDYNDINSFGLYDKENRIIVFQEANTDKSIKEFRKNVSDSGCIVFAKSEGPLVNQTYLNPGDQIITMDSGGSMAYRAKRNGVNGIVTCGHVATTTATGDNWVTDVSGAIFAECTARQESGSVDAAFCKIVGSGNTATNDLMGGSLLTSTLNPAVGDVVYKNGSQGGVTSGTVLSTNYSGTFDGISFTNLSKASYSSSGGDSGGIVFTFNMSTSTGYTVGINKGKSGSNGVYTKASLANSALGISRY